MLYVIRFNLFAYLTFAEQRVIGCGKLGIIGPKRLFDLFCEHNIVPSIMMSH